MSELGDLLRQARERKAVSLEQAEAETRIRQRYLAALEEGDCTALPGQVYLRGFVQIYATYLGLDPQRVLALCPSTPSIATPAMSPMPSVGMPIERPGTQRWLAWLGVLLVLVALGALVWWAQPWKSLSSWLGARPTATVFSPPTLVATQAATAVPTLAPTAQVTVAPTAEPTATAVPSATALSTARSGVTVSLVVSGRSWVQVTADEKVAYSGVLADVTREWVGARSVAVRIGDASRVDVTVNGVHLGLLGRPEEVVSGSWGPDFSGQPTPTATPN